jgi:hypothetical protein
MKTERRRGASALMSNAGRKKEDNGRDKHPSNQATKQPSNQETKQAAMIHLRSMGLGSSATTQYSTLVRSFQKNVTHSIVTQEHHRQEVHERRC